MKRHYKILILIMVFGLSACAPVSKTKPVEPLPPAAPMMDAENALFSRGERIFRAKYYNEALQIYNEYLSRYPNGSFAPMALIRQGAIYLEWGNYDTARNVYDYLIERYPASPSALQARVEILETYYKQKAYNQVIQNANDTLKKIPPGGTSYRFKVYLLTAHSYAAMGSLASAVYFYEMARNDLAGFERQMRAQEEENVLAVQRDLIRNLPSVDVLFLMERIKKQPVAGYLTYQLGFDYYNEGKLKEAFHVLSGFANALPSHEYAGLARDLLEKLDQSPVYDQYTVGCLLPLSGKYKVYGNRAIRGIQLALNQSASRFSHPPVNLIIRDTASDPNQAVLKVRELANARVSAIIGPIITAEAAASEAQRRRIPIVTLTQKEHIINIGDYVFRNFITPEMQVRTIVSYAIERLGLRRFAILYPDEKYGVTFMNLFQKAVTSRGGEVVGAASYLPGQTDFTHAIRQIGRRCDSIFIPDGPAKAGLIIPQLAFHDLNVQLFGTNLWHSNDLIKMARKYVQGAIMPDGFWSESNLPHVRSFTDMFQDTFKSKPEFMDAVAYDTANLIFQILEKSNIRFGNTVKDELLRLHAFQGVTGNTSFDENGDAVKNLYLLRIKGRKFVEIGD